MIRAELLRADTVTSQGAYWRQEAKAEDTRWQISGEAIEELRRYGGWTQLI
jgi:hypothetical protein